MNTNNIASLSVFISVLSLIVSCITAYFAYLRPAKLNMLVGRILILTNTYIDRPNGREWGGVSFILPFTFYNWSSKGSSVYQIKLALERQDNQTTNFVILWSGFIRFVDNGTKLENDTVAHPIPISGQSSISKFIRFDWSPLRTNRIEIRTGDYNITFYAWTSGEITKKADLKETISFSITDSDVEFYNKTVEQNLVIPIEILLGQNQPVNSVMTRQDVESKCG